MNFYLDDHTLYNYIFFQKMELDKRLEMIENKKKLKYVIALDFPLYYNTIFPEDSNIETKNESKLENLSSTDNIQEKINNVANIYYNILSEKKDLKKISEILEYNLDNEYSIKIINDEYLNKRKEIESIIIHQLEIKLKIFISNSIKKNKIIYLIKY